MIIDLAAPKFAQSPLVFDLPAPPSLSGCFNNVQGRGRVPTKRYTKWRREAHLLVTAQLSEKGLFSNKDRKLQGAYGMLVAYNPPDQRKRDLGNLDKATSDLFVDLRIVEDDSDCSFLAYYKSSDPAPGFIRVLIGPAAERPEININFKGKVAA